MENNGLIMLFFLPFPFRRMLQHMPEKLYWNRAAHRRKTFFEYFSLKNLVGKNKSFTFAPS
jgi:hypothetical protein